MAFVLEHNKENRPETREHIWKQQSKLLASQTPRKRSQDHQWDQSLNLPGIVEMERRQRRSMGPTSSKSRGRADSSGYQREKPRAKSSSPLGGSSTMFPWHVVSHPSPSWFISSYSYRPREEGPVWPRAQTSKPPSDPLAFLPPAPNELWHRSQKHRLFSLQL